MFSGGDDSLCAYHVVRELEMINLDFVLHVNTRTGIRETTEYVRGHVAGLGDKLIIADAGSSYEDYILRKGFFGVGRQAHTFAYHILKANPCRRAISKTIRKGKRNRPVLLINGARKGESKNRMANFREPHRRGWVAPMNIWVNILHNWTKQDCIAYLQERKIARNPVSVALHRSGECMCGTMQSLEERKWAEGLYPNWGNWLRDLEQKAHEKGFHWNWGENPAKEIFNGQMSLFQPMCVGCDLHINASKGAEK
jgi:3'-phosphoadenosine 5'-phosphosulfate sulfotransferase (PAPS reductase)/FAD synthetase